MTPGQRGLLAAAAVGLVVGGLLGWSRGSAGISDGSITTTVPITRPPAPESGPTTPPVALEAPRVDDVTTVDFANGMPHDVDFHDVAYDEAAWVGVNGTALAARAVALDPGAHGPPAYDRDKDWEVDAGHPVTLAAVRLLNPTPSSGVIARFEDAKDYWAVVVGADLRHVELVQVSDGTATSKGFVDHAVRPGTSIGLAAFGDTVTITIDGRPRVLTTFFGRRSAVSLDGADGTGVGLLVGSGQPAFDDLRYG